MPYWRACRRNKDEASEKKQQEAVRALSGSFFCMGHRDMSLFQLRYDMADDQHARNPEQENQQRHQIGWENGPQRNSRCSDDSGALKHKVVHCHVGTAGVIADNPGEKGLPGRNVNQLAPSSDQHSRHQQEKGIAVQDYRVADDVQQPANVHGRSFSRMADQPRDKEGEQDHQERIFQLYETEHFQTSLFNGKPIEKRDALGRELVG